MSIPPARIRKDYLKKHALFAAGLSASGGRLIAGKRDEEIEEEKRKRFPVPVSSLAKGIYTHISLAPN